MARSLTHHIQKGKICEAIGGHFLTPFSHKLLSPSSGTILLVSPHHTHRRDNMVKTGIPFMLHDNTGSLLASNFVDLYDRMILRVACRRRDPDGAAVYEVYNMLSIHHDIPVAFFEYGAAGALGDISLIGPGGSLRTQTMATFLVEVGGYANAISPFRAFPHHPPPLLLHTSAHAVFLQTIDHATGNSSLLMAMNIAGVGERAQRRISSGL